MQYTILPNMTGKTTRFSEVPTRGSHYNYSFLKQIPKKGAAILLLNNVNKPVESIRRAIQTSSRLNKHPRNTSIVGDLMVVW